MSESSYVIIEGKVIKAVTNVGFQTNETQEATLLLNGTGINRKIASAPRVQCNIEKFLINADSLFSLTGRTDLTGQFIHNESALNFSAAAISSLGVQISNDNLPTINFSLDIFDDLTPATPVLVASMDSEESAVNVSKTGIFLNIDNNTNICQSFEYSANFDVVPTYQIESIEASTVKILPPVAHQAQATFEYNDQTLESVTGLVSGESFNRPVTLTVSGESGVLASFSVPNASLGGQSIQQAARNTEQLSLSFVGYSTF